MYKHIPDVRFCNQLLQLLCDRVQSLVQSDEKISVVDQLLLNNRHKLTALHDAIASKQLIKCCLYDGQPLSDQSVIVRCPNRRNRHGTYGFYDYVFCSLSCVKTYLETCNNFSPHLLVWLTIHAKRDLGILEDFESAPARELLQMYRTDDSGITISSFREFGQSHKFTERIKHLPLNRELWEDEEQQNAQQPFFELIRDKKRVERQLYQEYVDTGKPIPKAAILDDKELALLAQEREEDQLIHDLNIVTKETHEPKT